MRCHGSIKQMEKYFGVSYPTIKNRLNKIGSQLSFVEIEQGSGNGAACASTGSDCSIGSRAAS